MHTEMKGTNRDTGRERETNLVQSFSISLICWHMGYSITKNKIPLGRKNNQITMKFNLLTEAENKDTSSRTDYKTH